MTNYSAKTIDEYIASALPEALPHLEELRDVVKSAIPEAEEGIHYGKPYYKYRGKYLAGFDVYKHHIGFEIWTDALATKDRQELEEMGYKTGSRTFQIRYDQNVPAAMINKLLTAQAATIKQ